MKKTNTMNVKVSESRNRYEEIKREESNEIKSSVSYRSHKKTIKETCKVENDL